MHAAYRCRHRAACCTAGWAIPVDAPTFETLRVHFGDKPGNDARFETQPPLPDGAAAVVRSDGSGTCTFLEPGRGNLCAVHRELGPEALPVACRQFPRVTLRDPRGTFVSLSHYCPTAAGMLIDAAPIAIVDAPPSLTLNGTVEGLDARDALPPLLRPGMLCDLEGYDAWERGALSVLAREGSTPVQAIAVIHAATQRIQEWRPGRGPLASVVRDAFDVAPAAGRDEDGDADLRRVREAVASVPCGLVPPPIDPGFPDKWPAVAGRLTDADRVVRAYLASRLFGNWVAYHGLGLHAIIEYLRVVLSVFQMEAVRHDDTSTASPWHIVTEAMRHADLLLVHLSDPKDLARRLS